MKSTHITALAALALAGSVLAAPAQAADDSACKAVGSWATTWSGMFIGGAPLAEIYPQNDPDGSGRQAVNQVIAFVQAHPGQSPVEYGDDIYGLCLIGANPGNS